MYTNQEKREIERVLTAFKPYIEQADYVEIVWSNKKQCYVALFIDTTRDTFEGADAILSAEEISERFYTEIGNDILLENDRVSNLGDVPFRAGRVPSPRPAV